MTAERIGSFSVRVARAEEPMAAAPLIVAIHGGTYDSTYFDIKGHSLLARAAANGISAVAIDRPGYGDTAMLGDGAMGIAGQGEHLAQALAEIFDEEGRNHSGLFLIGHSIGAAITATIASEPKDLPLVGIALSGIGVRTPAEHGPQWESLPNTPHVEMPRVVKEALMFGPAGSFSEAMLEDSHVANAPCPRAELIDIVGEWQGRAPAVLSKIGVPVHYRQAEHDHLWVVDRGEVDTFARMLVQSPRVDAALFAGTGHCIDLHHAGPALHLQQLGFAVECGLTAT